MSELVKVKVVNYYWYQGRNYRVGEELILPLHTLEEIGIGKFEILNKVFTKYPNKMFMNYYNKGGE